jgi:hypothetical protein
VLCDPSVILTLDWGYLSASCSGRISPKESRCYPVGSGGCGKEKNLLPCWQSNHDSLVLFKPWPNHYTNGAVFKWALGWNCLEKAGEEKKTCRTKFPTYFCLDTAHPELCVVTLHILNYVLWPCTSGIMCRDPAHRELCVVTLHIRNYVSWPCTSGIMCRDPPHPELCVVTLHIRSYVSWPCTSGIMCRGPAHPELCVVTLHIRNYVSWPCTSGIMCRGPAHPELCVVTLHIRNYVWWPCTSGIMCGDPAHPELCVVTLHVYHTYVLSIYRANKEDNELEDPEHQSVFRSTCSFPLGLQHLIQILNASLWSSS